ncbi:hypothetical protein C8A03DRAFT_38540 [Achaetomium macrosporum]|uniref:Uncharacterized protein n=1 Tax=Achaetomium macrosporum TaxID=79813 RepID=A0AAN7C3E4_9PEZI|nr:hypothetical protein C8A03DRAFT_38540 [Achaetomium macrosporum]
MPFLQDKLNSAEEVAFREKLGHIARESATPILDAPPRGDGRDNATSHPEQSGQVNAHKVKSTLPTQIRAKVHNANSRYFQLPDAIRLKIMKYVVKSHNPHNKPIRMNNPYFLHDVWPVNRLNHPKEWSTNYFDSLESVLSSLDNYTSVCSAMRADVLATLFLTRHFHVVYALGVTKALQSAATEYMDRYGPLMASITLEVDFTKLGGSWEPEAANLSALEGLRAIQALIERFVDRQLTGRRGTAIRDLRVLVRRYYGFRPAPAEGAEQASDSETPYTPDEHVAHVLDPLQRLGSRIDALTLSGTSQTFAMELIASLRDTYADSDFDPNTYDNELRAQEVQYRTPAREWPLMLPGSDQECVVDCGPGGGGVKLITWDERAGMDWEVAGCCRLLVPDNGRAGNANANGDEASNGAEDEDGSPAENSVCDNGGEGPRIKGLWRKGRKSARSLSGVPVTLQVLFGRTNVEEEAARDREVEDGKENRKEQGGEIGEGRGHKTAVKQRVIEKVVSGGGKVLFGYY